MNPMIRKELNERMRERRGWILPSLYLLGLGAISLLVYYAAVSKQFQSIQGADIGVPLFITAVYAQLALLLLLAPVFSAGSITIEKEQRTLAALLTSLLGRQEIWAGKFVSSLLFVLLLLCTSLPVLGLSFAFGGVGPWEVAIAVLTTTIILAAVSAIGLYWSSVFRRSVHSTAVTYATVIVLSVVSVVVFFMISAYQKQLSWNDMRFSKIPLYFNPFFFVTVSFASPKDLYPEWWLCLAVWLGLGTLSALLAIFNLRRTGESL